MAEAAFLLRTGWTYREYLDTPDDVVEAMFEVLNAEADVARERAREAGNG